MRLVLKRRIKANLTNFSDEQSQARLSYAMKRSKSAKLIKATLDVRRYTLDAMRIKKNIALRAGFKGFKGLKGFFAMRMVVCHVGGDWAVGAVIAWRRPEGIFLLFPVRHSLC